MIIIGSFLCVAAAVGVFMLMIKPQQAALKAAQARVDKAITLGNVQARDKAISDLNAAILQVSKVQQDLDLEMRRRMPDLSFARRDLGMLQLWNEQIKTLGPLLEKFARDKSVKVLSANFAIPAPPANPNDPIFDSEVLVFPLGQVQVQGDFRKLMNNIQRWNNCRRLVMVSPPTLTGVSPQLVATYSLTCYIFPVAKGGPKIEMAGAGGAAGATGAPGGMPAGAPPPMPGPAGPPAAPGM
ncbi:MAG: hypothetical protein ABFD54_12050 [Armatimonadota bacterium]